jgi:hypothetical protein
MEEMEEIEDPDQDLLEDPDIINNLQNNNNINTIRTARNNIRRGKLLTLTVLISKKKILKNKLNEVETTFNDLVRDQTKLKYIFYDYFNQQFPTAIKNRAAVLLEIILGKEPNSGLLVELQDLKKDLNDAISRIHSRRKSAGGNPNKKKNRKSKKQSRRVH